MTTHLHHSDAFLNAAQQRTSTIATTPSCSILASVRAPALAPIRSPALALSTDPVDTTLPSSSPSDPFPHSSTQGVRVYMVACSRVHSLALTEEGSLYVTRHARENGDIQL